MKIRNDFVTNSSSSSYVIAYKAVDKENEDNVYAKIYHKIILAIVDVDNKDVYGDTTTGSIISSKDEYDCYVLDLTGCKTMDEVWKNQYYDSDYYTRITNYLDNGYKIIEKMIDYSDSGLINLLYKISEDNENFIIVGVDE